VSEGTLYDCGWSGPDPSAVLDSAYRPPFPDSMLLWGGSGVDYRFVTVRSPKPLYGIPVAYLPSGLVNDSQWFWLTAWTGLEVTFYNPDGTTTTSTSTNASGTWIPSYTDSNGGTVFGGYNPGAWGAPDDFIYDGGAGSVTLNYYYHGDDGVHHAGDLFLQVIFSGPVFDGDVLSTMSGAEALVDWDAAWDEVPGGTTGVTPASFELYTCEGAFVLDGSDTFIPTSSYGGAQLFDTAPGALAAYVAGWGGIMWDGALHAKRPISTYGNVQGADGLAPPFVQYVGGAAASAPITNGGAAYGDLNLQLGKIRFNGSWHYFIYELVAATGYFGSPPTFGTVYGVTNLREADSYPGEVIDIPLGHSLEITQSLSIAGAYGWTSETSIYLVADYGTFDEWVAGGGFGSGTYLATAGGFGGHRP